VSNKNYNLWKTCSKNEPPTHTHGNSTYGTCLAWKGNNEGGWDHKLGLAIA
jgi:hypothetical protein